MLLFGIFRFCRLSRFTGAIATDELPVPSSRLTVLALISSIAACYSFKCSCFSCVSIRSFSIRSSRSTRSKLWGFQWTVRLLGKNNKTATHFNQKPFKYDWVGCRRSLDQLAFYGPGVLLMTTHDCLLCFVSCFQFSVFGFWCS